MMPIIPYRVTRATPISIVSTSTGGGQSTASGTGFTTTVTKPASIVTGNLLYAFAVCDDTNGTTPTFVDSLSAWTRHTFIQFSTNNNFGYIIGLYKWATSSEPASYTFGGSTTDAFAIGIMQLSGVNATTPFAAVSSLKGASSTSAAFHALTTTSSGSVLLGAAQAGNFSSSVSTGITWGSGYSSAFNANSQDAAGANAVDSEIVVGGFLQTQASGTFTPPTATWTKAYFTGTIDVALNHA